MKCDFCNKLGFSRIEFLRHLLKTHKLSYIEVLKVFPFELKEFKEALE